MVAICLGLNVLMLNYGISNTTVLEIPQFITKLAIWMAKGNIAVTPA